MATFDNKELVDKLVAHNGLWPGGPDEDGPPDPRVVLIVEYENYVGATCWGIVWAGDPHPLRYFEQTQYVNNPRVYWQYKP